MVNPQLGGIKGLPTNLFSNNLGNTSGSDNTIESQRAVDGLFASCEDSDTWASYPKNIGHNSREGRRKRKSNQLDNESGGRARLGAVDPDDLDEETVILKRAKMKKLQNEFKDDAELTKELENFRLLSQNSSDSKDSDDFWDKLSNDDDIISQMNLFL